MATVSKEIVKEVIKVSKVAIGVLAAIALFGIFAIGFDTGQIEQAFASAGGANPNNNALMWLHEFSHDIRHAAGFVCH